MGCKLCCRRLGQKRNNKNDLTVERGGDADDDNESPQEMKKEMLDDPRL